MAKARKLTGSRGTLVLRRIDGDQTEFETILLFDSLEDVRAFAGDDIEEAVFYPEDDRYLVERDLGVDPLRGRRPYGVERSGRARWPNRSSKPVRRRNPPVGQFDSGAAPLLSAFL